MIGSSSRFALTYLSAAIAGLVTNSMSWTTMVGLWCVLAAAWYWSTRSCPTGRSTACDGDKGLLASTGDLFTSASASVSGWGKRLLLKLMLARNSSECGVDKEVPDDQLLSLLTKLDSLSTKPD